MMNTESESAQLRDYFWRGSSSLVSTLHNSALHNCVVSSLWSDKSETRRESTNQDRVCFQSVQADHFSASLGPRICHRPLCCERGWIGANHDVQNTPREMLPVVTWGGVISSSSPHALCHLPVFLSTASLGLLKRTSKKKDEPASCHAISV